MIDRTGSSTQAPVNGLLGDGEHSARLVLLPAHACYARWGPSLTGRDRYRPHEQGRQDHKGRRQRPERDRRDRRGGPPAGQCQEHHGQPVTSSAGPTSTGTRLRLQNGDAGG